MIHELLERLEDLIEAKTRLPANLYHVTLLDSLPKIMRHGLKPRGGGSPVWGVVAAGPHVGSESNPDYVYLASKGKHVVEAFRQLEGEQDDVGVVLLKVSTKGMKRDLLRPDEDWGEDEPWEESLKGMGSVAYEGKISKTSITPLLLSKYEVYSIWKKGEWVEVSQERFDKELAKRS